MKKDRLQESLAGWLMEFGTREVPIMEYLGNKWYRDVCYYSALGMSKAGYLTENQDARGITQKGLDFIKEK